MLLLAASPRVEPDAAQGAAELLQESAESRAPRKLCGEPWCGSWKTASNRTEDFGCWFYC